MNRIRPALMLLFSFIPLFAASAQAERPQTLPPVPTRVWEQEAVARGIDNSPGERFLAIDAAGRPHLVYGGNNLYYAYYDGAAWRTELVDGDREAGARATLTLDAAGRPHIAYYAAGKLRYAVREAGGWRIEDLFTGWLLAVSLALDGAGRPLVAYRAEGDFDPDGLPTIRLARRDASGWREETVARGKGLAHYLTLVVDGRDRPAVLYSEYAIENDEQTRQAYLARPVGSVWASRPVAPLCPDDWFAGLALAVGGDDRAHVVLETECDGGLDYLVETAAGWSPAAAITESAVAGPELLIDDAGRPNVVFLDAPAGIGFPAAIQYAILSGGTWQIEPVGPPGRDFYTVSPALNDAGEPYLAAWENTPPDPPYCCDGALRFFSREAGDWREEQVDRSGQVGQHQALALDGAAQPHLVYWDERRLALRYAAKIGGAWRYETIETGFWTGRTPNVAVDGRGRVHAVYRFESDDRLQYALREGGVWRVETIGRSRDAAGLAVDARNRPHVVYADRDGVIRYRFFGGGRWTEETIGDPPLRGDHVALALDAAGRPHVLIVETNNNGGFIYAMRRGAADWMAEGVAPDNYAQLDGAYIPLSNSPQAIAVDAQGEPYVVISLEDYVDFRPPKFYDYLLLLHRREDWEVEELEVFFNHRPDSLTVRVGGDGKAHVALNDGLFEAVYWRQTDGGWRRQAFEWGWGRVGLALDGEDRAYLSYQDDDDLVLQRQVNRLLTRHTILPLVVGED